MMEDFLSLNPFLFANMEFALGLIKNDDEELMSFADVNSSSSTSEGKAMMMMMKRVAKVR